MKLSTKRHGQLDAFYYPNPEVFHRYRLNGRTITDKLTWMFSHITERRADLNKSDLRLVASEDGVRMANVKTGARMFVEKKGKFYRWYEEARIDISNMHEDYGYNE
jgi:hypothetical protein